MTSKREKFRAITLTLLMIGSVVGGTVALSGAAAANSHTTDQNYKINGNNSSATVDTVGDDVTVSVNTTNIPDSATVTVQHVYNDKNVTVNTSATSPQNVTFQAAKDDGQDNIDQTQIKIYVNGSVEDTDDYSTENYLVKTTQDVLWGETAPLEGQIYEYPGVLEDDINVDYGVYGPDGMQVAQGDTDNGEFAQRITFDYLNSTTQDKDYPADNNTEPSYTTYVREDPNNSNPGATPAMNNGSANTQVLVDAVVNTNPSNVVYGDTAEVSGTVLDGQGNALTGYPVEVRSPESSKTKGTDTAGDGSYLFTMTFDDAGTWVFGTNRSGYIQYETINVDSATGDLTIEPNDEPANFESTWTVTFTDEDGDAINTSGDSDSFVNLTVNFDSSKPYSVSPNNGSATFKNPDGDGVMEYVVVQNTTSNGQFEITGTPVGSQITGDAQWEETTRDTPSTPDVVATGSASLQTAGDFVVVNYDIQDSQNNTSPWVSIDTDGDDIFGESPKQTVRVLPINDTGDSRVVNNERVGNSSNFGFDGITNYRFVLDVRNSSNNAYTFDGDAGSKLNKITVTGAGVNKTITSASDSDYDLNGTEHRVVFKPTEKPDPNEVINVTFHTDNGEFTKELPVSGLRITKFLVNGQQRTSTPVGTDLTITSVVTEADGEFVNNGQVRVSQETSTDTREVLGEFDARTSNTNDGEYNFNFTVDRVATDQNDDGIAETDAPLVFTAYQYSDADGDQALEQNEVTEATVRTLEVDPVATINVSFISNEEHEYLGADGGNLTAGVRYDNITVQLTRDGQPVDLTDGVDGVELTAGQVGQLLTIEGHNTTVDLGASDPANGTYVVTEINSSNGEAVDAQYDDGYIAFNSSHVGDSISVSAVTPDKSYSTAADEDSFEVVAPVVEEEVTQVTNANGATVNVSDVETMTAGINRTYTVEATVTDQAGVPINGTSDDAAKVVITLEDGTSQFVAVDDVGTQEHFENGEAADSANVDSWPNWKFPTYEDARHIVTDLEDSSEEGNLMMSTLNGGIDENGTFTFQVTPTNADDLAYLVSQNVDGSEETADSDPRYGVDLDNDGDIYDDEEYEAHVLSAAEDSGLDAEDPIVNVFDVSGGVIPEQNFATSDNKRLIGPSGVDDNGIVVPKGVNDKVRIEVFPADTDDAALPPVYIGLESTDPVAESGVFTLTNLISGESNLTSNFTQGQVGQIEFTPTGTGEDIIQIRWSFQSSDDVLDGSATTVEFFDVAQSTDSLNVTVDTQNPTAGGEIVGTVFDTDGGPVENARVFVTLPDGDTLTLETDAAGEYSFNAPESGSYEISAVRVGFEPSNQISVDVTGQAAVTFNDQTTDGQTVDVASVTLPEGGYVVIHANDSGTPGEVLGASEYIEPGTTTAVTVTLDNAISSNQTLFAMAHRDTDGDQLYEFPQADGPYTVDGSPVTDAASITVDSVDSTLPAAVQDADTDDNGDISDGELDSAISAWAQGQYTDEELDTIITYWATS